MDLVTMTQAFRYRVGNPTTADLPDQTIHAFLNESVFDHATFFNFNTLRKHWSFQTTIGVAQYATPAGLDILRKLGLENNNAILKLDRINQDKYMDLFTTQHGVPSKYYRGMDYIELLPPPDSTYTVHVFYTATPQLLVNQNDVIPFPATWGVGIVRYAVYLYYASIQDIAKSTFWYNDWKLWLSLKKDEHNEELATDFEASIQLADRADGMGYKQDPFEYKD